MTAPHILARRSSLRVGVIGCGRIGRMHAAMVASQVPGAMLVAVSDAVAGAAEEVASSHGVPTMSTEDLVANPGIDAVAICAPTDTHVDLVIAAAQAGKAIFCEKPLSLDLQATDQALAAAEQNGATLMVGFNRRFDPSHACVQAAVANGTVGQPSLARITSRDPAPPPMSYARVSGGIFLDMTVHDFDMARFVVGSEVLEVYAAGTVRVDPQLAEIGDVDTAVVTLWHQNDCLTVIDNSRRASYGYDQRVEVLGSNGLAASDNPLENTGSFRDANGSRSATLPYFFIERYAASYLRQWEAFVSAVSSGSAAPTSGGDGRAALVLGLAAKQSLLEHRPVRTSEVGTSPVG